MNNYPLVWVIIGVSGSGKTTIGRWLSNYLECDYLEGDRRHPPANIIKMSSKKSLEDADRRQWLETVKADIRWSLDRNRELVITCSALKADHRQQLKSLGRVQLVWIKVPTAILKQRLANRNNHFMGAEMLDSQIAAFETIQPDENIITIDGIPSINSVVSELKAKITKQFPILEKPWWERGLD